MASWLKFMTTETRDWGQKDGKNAGLKRGFFKGQTENSIEIYTAHTQRCRARDEPRDVLEITEKSVIRLPVIGWLSWYLFSKFHHRIHNTKEPQWLGIMKFSV